MIKTTMSIQILEASEGMMLTNGETYSEKVFLSLIDSPDNWREITMEQYEQILAAQQIEEEQ